MFVNFSYSASAGFVNRIYTMLNKKTSKFSRYQSLSLSTNLSKRAIYSVSDCSPTRRFTSLPFLIISTVGIAVTPYFSAMAVTWSTSTLHTVTLSTYLSARSDMVGARTRQGGQRLENKSTRQMPFASSTRVLKSALLLMWIMLELSSVSLPKIPSLFIYKDLCRILQFHLD